MKLYVMRHGQTEWNRERRLQGQVEVALNETGIAQAYETKRRLAAVEFDLILCSPIGRARQTADIINEDRNLEIICDERLMERGFGEYEGGSWRDLDWVGSWSWEKNLQFEKAENIRNFYGRVFEWLEELPKRWAGKQVLVVCHMGVMRALAYYFSGKTMTAKEVAFFKTENAEVQEYELPDCN